MLLDTASLRKDFPILARQIEGKRLVYLDSAATSLKPRQVIDRVTHFYRECTANVHRAVHQLSEEATTSLEEARATVANFINADDREIAFVRNSTEALNIVAHNHVGESLTIVPLSEHHSNLLPWRRGQSTYLDVDQDFCIATEKAVDSIVKHRPSVLAFSSISNALGYRLPVDALVEAGRSVGATIVIDLSQSVGHEPVDVQSLDCDYAVFSGHKMLGPSGVGVLFQREGTAKPVDPVYLGGEMVHEVHVDDFEPRPFPWSIEAGTPNIEGIMGLSAACDYLEDVGVESIASHCDQLCSELHRQLSAIDNIKVVTPKQAHYPGMVSFYVPGYEAHGIARILSNRFAIMTRSGYHCAQPLHEAQGLPETVRASLHLYNTREEIEALVDAVKTIVALA